MPEQVQYELSLKDLLTGKLVNADAAASKLEGTLRTVAIASGLAFGVAGVTMFASGVVEAGSKVENALTGLTTLLRDKAEAQQVINDTMTDAMKTPFAFEGLLSANKALISAGVESKAAREDVLNLANAIAATGGGDDELQRMVVNLQQIKNTGKATALDIKQFAYAGVNVYKILADATGKPIEKVKDMEVSYDMLTLALKKAHDQGGAYAGGLENMAGNTSVQISNLGDALFQLKVKMFNDLKPVIDKIIGGMNKFIGALRSAWDWSVRNKDLIQSVAIGIGVATASVWTYSIAVNSAAIATKIWTAAEWLLNAALYANPIGLVVAAIAAMVAAVVYAYKKFGEFRAFLWATWAVIKEVGSIIADFFIGLKDILVGTFTLDFDQVSRGWDKMESATFGASKRIGQAAKDGYEAGIKDFASQQMKEAVASPTTVKAPKGKTKDPTAAVSPETKGAKAAKNLTITIHIGSLVKEMQIRTTNITEGAAKVKEKIVETLTAALNDSQHIGEFQ